MADHEEIFAERKRRARIVDALKVTLEGAKPYEPSDFVDVVGAFMKPDEDTFQARRRLRARVAELEEAISADMSFEDAKELIDLKRMMRHQGADWKKAMHKHRAERGEPIPTQPWGNEDELNAKRAAKRKERQEREAAVEARLAKLEAALATAPLGYPDESAPQTEELERLRAENEELKEKLAATQLPPNPAETKLSDYIPAEISALMEPGETFTMARKRLSELLNVEKAELRLKRAAGSASDDDLKREADVDRLQGLFSKLGEI